MIGYQLPNNNEKCYSSILQKNSVSKHSLSVPQSHGVVSVENCEFVKERWWVARILGAFTGILHAHKVNMLEITRSRMYALWHWRTNKETYGARTNRVVLPVAFRSRNAPSVLVAAKAAAGLGLEPGHVLPFQCVNFVLDLLVVIHRTYVIW